MTFRVGRYILHGFPKFLFFFFKKKIELRVMSFLQRLSGRPNVFITLNNAFENGYCDCYKIPMKFRAERLQICE